ncbi:hypothetical protein EDD85DRAFT_1026610 [Armillaria nabsnona]|nr:hypothetical protein EDD85DRAFT_1026610 [Armillaria nabsnona]
MYGIGPAPFYQKNSKTAQRLIYIYALHLIFRRGTRETEVAQRPGALKFDPADALEDEGTLDSLRMLTYIIRNGPARLKWELLGFQQGHRRATFKARSMRQTDHDCNRAVQIHPRTERLGITNNNAHAIDCRDAPRVAILGTSFKDNQVEQDDGCSKYARPFLSHLTSSWFVSQDTGVGYGDAFNVAMVSIGAYKQRWFMPTISLNRALQDSIRMFGDIR